MATRPSGSLSDTPAYLPERLRYAPAARVLHWLIAVLVLGIWPLGMVISVIVEETKPSFYLAHESLGFLVLWLMLARLAIRLVRGAPPRPPMPAWQSRLATLVHTLLYVALIAMPVLGFLATNAYGFPLQWFGLVAVPSPIGKSPDLASILMGAHATLGWVILGLFVLHVAGVIHHQAIRRDQTLQRMI